MKFAIASTQSITLHVYRLLNFGQLLASSCSGDNCKKSRHIYVILQVTTADMLACSISPQIRGKC